MSNKSSMTLQTGKRYRCSTCGAEIVITKAGAGSIECHRKPVEPRLPVSQPARKP